MANEITGSVSITASKNGAAVSASATIAATMSGEQMISNVQIIGTSSEALVLGDVTTIGYVYLKNLDATNFVSISVLATAVAGTSFTKLLPGECCLFKAVSTTITAIADTSAVNLQVVAIEL
jgi:hypothetical protein